MPNIFNYQDYRQFLGDYYEEKKAMHPSFSYQSFSQKAGFASKSFVFNVIKGEKALSRNSVVKLSIAMNLSKTESAYFENLVYFNQSSDFAERNFYFEKLNAIRPVTVEASQARNLRKDQYEFYSQWYHAVIRSLIDLYPSINDPHVLARMVYPPLSPKQVQKSIELLLRLELIEKMNDGTYRISSKILSTGEELHTLAVQKFHLLSLENAAKALQSLPKNERNFSGLTLGISAEAYEKICSEINLFQKRILAIAENDNNSDRVYQLNLQLFPVSARAKIKRTAKKENDEK